jgi:hypothetical protein
MSQRNKARMEAEDINSVCQSLIEKRYIVSISLRTVTEESEVETAKGFHLRNSYRAASSEELAELREQEAFREDKDALGPDWLKRIRQRPHAEFDQLSDADGSMEDGERSISEGEEAVEGDGSLAESHDDRRFAIPKLDQIGSRKDRADAFYTSDIEQIERMAKVHKEYLNRLGTGEGNFF